MGDLNSYQRHMSGIGCESPILRSRSAIPKSEHVLYQGERSITASTLEASSEVIRFEVAKSREKEETHLIVYHATILPPMERG